MACALPQNDPGSDQPDNMEGHFFSSYLKARIFCQHVVATTASGSTPILGAINRYQYDVMSESIGQCRGSFGIGCDLDSVCPCG